MEERDQDLPMFEGGFGGAASEGLPPNHPLLQQAQASLQRQLVRRISRINEVIADSLAKKQAVEAEHSSLGQKLVEAQDRLRSMQREIQNLSTQEDGFRKRRMESEKEMQRVAEQLRIDEKEGARTLERLQKYQSDYNELKFALQKAKEHTSTLEDAIKLKRRQLYKDSETLRHEEQQKMRQDFFLDRLHGQVEEMVEMKGLLEAQIRAHEEDAGFSQAAIRESQNEIEEVVRGKRQLRMQLGGCLNGLKMRSRAEASIKEAIEKQESEASAVQDSIREKELFMRELQETNENLTVQKNSTSCQLSSVRSQTAKANENQTRLRKQIDVLTTSLQQAHQDASKAEALATSLSNQREAVVRGIQAATQECNALTDQIFEVIAGQASIDRAGAKHSKITKKLLQECELREDELVKVDFERAQLQVESVGIRAAVASVDEEIAELEKELSEKERLIDQYQAEIKKGHILIARKQQIVDQLNREYDAKRSIHGQDSSGPLDATIRSLKQQQSQNARNIADLQQAWIKKQTELINLQAKVGDKREEIAAKKDELIIRKQRNVRILGDLNETNREVKLLKTELNDMHYLVDRMGRQLAAFKEQQLRFENEAKANAEETELQLAERAKQKEDLEANLQKTKDERDGTLEELVDLERQILLWDRKITLEKEMQDALDPSIGQSELTEMRKVIHRMELKEQHLKKTQESLLQELQQMLEKREMINVRNEPRARENNETHQKVVLERQIASLSKRLSEVENKDKATEEKLAGVMQLCDAVQDQLALLTRNTKESEKKIAETKDSLERDRVRMAYEKASFVQLHTTLRKLEAVTDEDVKTELKPSVVLALHKAQSEAAKVANAIGAVQEVMPHNRPRYPTGAPRVSMLSPGCKRP